MKPSMAIAIQRAEESSRSTTPDSYLDSVAKLVPGEVLAAFLAALQAPGIDGHWGNHLAVLLLFTAVTPVVLLASARRSTSPAHWLQYVVRTSAFVLVATGADPILLSWLDGLRWIPSVGAIAIVLLAAAILSPPIAGEPPPL